MKLLRRTGRLVAVSAIFLVTTLTSACGTETPSPVADASESSSSHPASPSPSASSTPSASPLTTVGLETGPAPKIAYAVGGRLVLPDGGGFQLPKDTFDLARLGDLTVVMQPGPSDGMPVSVLDADGQVVKSDALSVAAWRSTRTATWWPGWASTITRGCSTAAVRGSSTCRTCPPVAPPPT